MMIGKKQIQLRMDLSNPSENKAICLIYSQLNIRDINNYNRDHALPFLSWDQNQPLLIQKKPYSLFNETINIEKKKTIIIQYINMTYLNMVGNF